MKKRYLFLNSILIVSLTSCENNLLELGDIGSKGNQEVLWEYAVKMKAVFEKEQDLISYYDVYPGFIYKPSFLKDWEENYFELSSQTGYFAIKISVLDINYKEIDYKLYKVEDLLDENKYLITNIIIPEGTYDFWIYEYSDDHITCSYDFNNIDINSGIVKIEPVFFDTINNEILVETTNIMDGKRLFYCWYAEFKFNKSENRINFYI